MHAVQKLTPPPIPAIARKEGRPTPVSLTPVRPTITVWIGNTSYQAIRV